MTSWCHDNRNSCCLLSSSFLCYLRCRMLMAGSHYGAGSFDKRFPLSSYCWYWLIMGINICPLAAHSSSYWLIASVKGWLTSVETDVSCSIRRGLVDPYHSDVRERRSGIFLLDRLISVYAPGYAIRLITDKISVWRKLISTFREGGDQFPVIGLDQYTLTTGRQTHTRIGNNTISPCLLAWSVQYDNPTHFLTHPT